MHTEPTPTSWPGDAAEHPVLGTSCDEGQLPGGQPATEQADA